MLNLAPTRDERAAQILSDNGVTLHNAADRTFDVRSQRNPAKTYRVNLTRQTCDCPDSLTHKCKHITACEKWEQRQAQTPPARKTYKSYDALLASFA